MKTYEIHTKIIGYSFGYVLAESEQKARKKANKLINNQSFAADADGWHGEEIQTVIETAASEENESVTKTNETAYKNIES